MLFHKVVKGHDGRVLLGVARAVAAGDTGHDMVGVDVVKERDGLPTARHLHQTKENCVNCDDNQRNLEQK